MTVRAGSKVSQNTGVGERFTITWSGLLNGDEGDAQELWNFADRSMQVTGTFGTGGQVTLLGSNDGTNWAVLTDPQGNNIVVTAAGIKLPAPITQYVKPLVAGDGSTNLAVTIFCRRS